MRSLISALVVLLASQLISACSGPTGPTDEVALSEIRKTILSEDRSNVFEVSDLKKTNGAKQGDGSYLINFEFDLVQKYSYEELSRLLTANQGFRALPLMRAMYLKYGQFKKGEKFHKVAAFRMVMSEKGWVVDKKDADPVIDRLIG